MTQVVAFIMIMRVTEATVSGPQLLRLAFNDGSRKTVDLSPLLSGPIFEPLRDPGYFARVHLDPVCGTVVWPNGADFAPEALRDLASVEETSVVLRDDAIDGRVLVRRHAARLATAASAEDPSGDRMRSISLNQCGSPM